MVINHNLLAMNADSQYRLNVKKKSKSDEKLASGYRINRAADDTAGLSISEKMRWQIRGLNKGEANSQDGISYLQVADGALNEVHDMIHRIKELSVQASNDTNTDDDRRAIQEEVNQICKEIDRIGDTTQFNTRYVFRGRDEEVYDTSGNTIVKGDINTSSFTTSNVDLGSNPFDNNSDPFRLNLSAIIKDNGNISSANGIEYPLIFGKGTTSHSYVRLISPTGVTKDYDMHDFKVDAGSYSYDQTTNTWSRTMSKDGIKIKQSIQGVDANASWKYYDMSYEISNDSTNLAFAQGYNAIFMFNADTAYGGNHAGDYEESYFTPAGELGKNAIYSTDNSLLTPKDKYDGSGVSYNNSIPDSISVINKKKALDFSEKIIIDDKSDVINVAIGYWNEVNKIGLFDKKSTITSQTNTSTSNEDLGFSIAWNLGDMSAGHSKKVSFKYGIQEAAKDNNIKGVTLTKDTTVVKRHFTEDNLWIQSGALKDSGLHIGVGEMNCDLLGLNGVDVSSGSSAQRANKASDAALQYVSDIRSKIGAQQNRLEYSSKIAANISENTQSAESRIRDTDLSEEIIENSKANILSQVGISMISQANSNSEGVLNLLR